MNTRGRAGRRSVLDIFNEDQGQSRQSPAWLLSQMFPPNDELEAKELSIVAPDLPKTKSVIVDDDNHSSDDGLGATPEFLSGQFNPARRRPKSIIRFPQMSRASSICSNMTAATSSASQVEKLDDDDDYEEDDDVNFEGDAKSAVDVFLQQDKDLSMKEEPPGDLGWDANVPETPPIVASPSQELFAAMSVDDIVLQATNKLLDAQSLFVKQLRLVERGYINIARAANMLHRKPRLLSERESTAVFVNWRELVAVATEVKWAMRIGRQAGADDSLAVLFSLLQTIGCHIASYSRLYLIYVSEHSYSSKQLIAIRQRREAFNELVELNEHCDEVTLQVLLQRPLLYMTEVRDVVRQLHRGLESQSELALASVKSTGIDALVARTYMTIAKCDDDIARESVLSEARSRVIAIQEKLFGGKINLVEPGRFCVRYGPLQKLASLNRKEGKHYTFFMFNDLLISAEGRNGQMRAKYVIDLQGIKVTEKGNTLFHIESSVKALMLSAMDDATARAWVADLKQHATNLALRRGVHNVRNPFELDAHVRDDSQKVLSTVEQSVEECRELLATRKEMTVDSIWNQTESPSFVQPNIPMAMDSMSMMEGDLDSRSAGSLTMASITQSLNPAFKIQLTTASQQGSPTGLPMFTKQAPDTIGAGPLIQGYLKMKTSAFGTLTSMFFILDRPRRQLAIWKLKADAQQTMSQPKKTISLRNSLVFSCDLADGAGFELFTENSRRCIVILAPDATTRDMWCSEISKFWSPDRICEGLLEKRGGSQATKPWRRRYFVLLHSYRAVLYFNKRQDATGPDFHLNAIGAIDVSDCSLSLLSQEQAIETMGRLHVIEVTPRSSRRHFFLAGQERGEMLWWIDRIRMLVTEPSVVASDTTAMD